MAKRTRQPAAPWGNRILATATVPAGQLLANPQNYRIHPGFQQEQLTESLSRIGFIQTVIVNRRTSPAWASARGTETVLDGHLRVALSLSRGEDTPVPVSYVDLDPQEEAYALASFDPIGALATTDKEQLDALLATVDDDERAILAALHGEKSRTKTVAFKTDQSCQVIVDCESEAQQSALLGQLRGEGYACRTN